MPKWEWAIKDGLNVEWDLFERMPAGDFSWDAYHLFNQMPKQDAVGWENTRYGYAKTGSIDVARECKKEIVLLCFDVWLCSKWLLLVMFYGQQDCLWTTKLTCNFFSNMWTMWSLGNYCASRDQFRQKSFHSYEHSLHHLVMDLHAYIYIWSFEDPHTNLSNKILIWVKFEYLCIHVSLHRSLQKKWKETNQNCIGSIKNQQFLSKLHSKQQTKFYYELEK